jgi:hypothetical protein
VPPQLPRVDLPPCYESNRLAGTVSSSSSCLQGWTLGEHAQRTSRRSTRSPPWFIVKLTVYSLHFICVSMQGIVMCGFSIFGIWSEEESIICMASFSCSLRDLQINSDYNNLLSFTSCSLGMRRRIGMKCK